MVLAMCCACSFPLCRFPEVGGRQKQAYNNVDTTFSETARDKPSDITANAVRRTAREVNIDDFAPGEALPILVLLI
jgi:hypothetical protein